MGSRYICEYHLQLTQKLESIGGLKNLDFDVIDKATLWAKEHHGKQTRKSGEPFYSHPLEVASKVANYRFKTDVIAAAILHDVVEDTKVTSGMIVDEFGWRIGQMVDRLTRDRPDGTKWSVRQILENAYNEGDMEVILIKLADRLHNMETIGAKSPEKIIKTANETLDLFIAFAIYAEANEFAEELYSACCKALNIQQSAHPEQENSLLYSETKNDSDQIVSQVFQSIVFHKEN